MKRDKAYFEAKDILLFFIFSFRENLNVGTTKKISVAQILALEDK